MVRVGVIGGSGIYRLLEEPEMRKIDTPFGIAQVYLGEFGGERIAFIPRHGEKHSIPPFRVNYRANIYALNLLGVERILATNAVGAINPELEPGTIVLPHDFIDLTKCRASTFYDGRTSLIVRGKVVSGVVHVSMTPHTYCPEIRAALLDAAEEIGIQVVDRGVYVCAEGNRFETPAEIRAMSILGGDLVGMTGCPEAALARELAICYASISVVTNYAAGVGGRVKLTHQEVLDIFSRRLRDLSELLAKTISRIPKERSCACKDALEGFLGE
ncbi:MAG: S-methyl-5'-thioinosine phosphorylase [Candidatus Korarchaeota archaeon]|nr:S-methyl-5'-thioinosine phosphorylase [Candidatus Korarchaeota archaeon]